MPRRERQPAQTVSLFPFLAVLVCAMGSLILLLLIITRHVRPEPAAHASRIADEITLPEAGSGPFETESSQEPEPSIPAEEPPEWRDEPPAFESVVEVSPMLEVAEEVAEQTDIPEPEFPDAIPYSPLLHGDPQVIAEEEMLRKQIANGQREREMLAQELAKLRQTQQQEQARLKEIVDRLSRQASMKKQAEQESAQYLAENQSRQQEISTVAADISRKSRELQEVRTASEERQNKLEIVTYDGPAGIRRQPIFIECTSGEVIFHPEGVALSTHELEEYPVESSPLAYAVRALAAHRNKKQQDSLEPYVLMIARPNGIKEFYGCGQILTVHRIPFGYELIAQDRELYLGKADAEARAILLEAFEEARRQSGQTPSRFAKMHQQAEATRNLPRELASRLPESTGSPPSGSARTRSGPIRSAGPGTPPAPLPRGEFPRGEPRGASALSGQAETRGTAIPRIPASESTPPALMEPASRDSDPVMAGKPVPTSPPPAGSRASSAGTARNWQSTNSRGNGGGLGNGSSGSASPGIQIEQSIAVKVYLDGIQVGKQAFEPWREDVSSADLQRVLWGALEREQETWGPPPEGIEWQPVLNLQVAPGGTLMAYRLENLAAEWDLKTRATLILGNSPGRKDTIFE
ncbi:MAG: hypothetical protein R3C12_16690 [Planctomycetaceae bacterium]|nr:hypothetical protein [Planctomycetaceae bacterium]